VTENASVYDVLVEMVETGDKAHRRALIFGEGEPRDLTGLKSIISQAAIINLIGTHKKQTWSSCESDSRRCDSP